MVERSKAEDRLRESIAQVPVTVQDVAAVVSGRSSRSGPPVDVVFGDPTGTAEQAFHEGA